MVRYREVRYREVRYREVRYREVVIVRYSVLNHGPDLQNKATTLHHIFLLGIARMKNATNRRKTSSSYLPHWCCCPFVSIATGI